MPDSTESPLLRRALDRLDAVNASDPRRELVDGRPEPRELVYAHRMTRTLEQLEPHASEALRLAVRAQHIARWRIPRSEFPMDRRGYKRWRSRLMGLHAQVAAEVLREVGYEESTVERVGELVRKVGIARDPEAQTLEDVACLVFLEHYLDAFARSHDDDKLVDILRKTWGKMSERGRTAALELELGERPARLLERALAGGARQEGSGAPLEHTSADGSGA